MPKTFSGLDIPTRPAKSNGLHPGGAPGFALTPEIEALIENLARDSCSMNAIAMKLGVDIQVLTDNKEFNQAYKRGKADYLIELHRGQYASAFHAKNEMVRLTGQVWLGKQEGQTDKVESRQQVSSFARIEYHIITDKPQPQLQEAIEGEVKVLPAPEDSPDNP